MSKPGGHSTPRVPSNDEIEFLTSDQVRDLLMTKISTITITTTSSGDGLNDKNYSLIPILITTQVVAGTVYQVKYKLVVQKEDDDQQILEQCYCHAKIFKPLPCNEPNQKPELMNFIMDDSKCTADSPLQL